jgi:predicted enzyme related to lactoylglutathione lyase
MSNNNRVVHFEIPCDNPETTMNFFKEVFGWTFKQSGTEKYWLANTGNENSPGINGGFLKKRDPKMPLANSIHVENIDEAIKKIEQAGGEVVVPKKPIPTVGWLAFFTDPDGNVHGILQYDSTVEEKEVKISEELHTA